jgi:hypothetical protein
MLYFYNLLGLLLTFLWNAAVLTGTLWLILFKDWSSLTLVTTLFFFIHWKEWVPKEPETEQSPKPKIILNDKI